MRVEPASRVWRLNHAIRELVPLARRLEAEGARILYLNLGDPLKYDFETPRHVREALAAAAEDGYNHYSPSEGDPGLREAIAERESRVKGVKIEPGDVIVTQGVAEAIGLTMAALLNPGDEILLPDPTYPLYVTHARVYEAVPVGYRCDPQRGWSPDLDDVRKRLTGRTKAIVVINPNNPTGAVYPRRVVEGILDIAAEHGLVVISDEIYDQIVFEGEAVGAAALARDVPVICFNGFSKAHLMTGWRLGYLYVYDPVGSADRLKEALVGMARTRLSAATPIQRAGIAALKGPQQHVDRLVQELKRRRDYACRRLAEMGLVHARPRGAFYVFPRLPEALNMGDREFAEKLLLEEHVLVVHGSGFGVYGQGHIRLVFLPPMETMEEAFYRIERFIRRHSR